MKANKTKRILFHGDDFKSRIWGEELKKRFNYEVVERESQSLFSHLKIILLGFFNNRRIHVFLFRYLNDCASLYESSLHLIRDILIVALCKILQVKIFWILHNIDRETQQYHPILTGIKRKIIYLASKKVFVTDPNLVEVATEYGIEKEKIDWICFGKPPREAPDQKNIDLKKKIIAFKKQLQNHVNSTVYLGLCVSRPARKKLHYLKAPAIVGMSKIINQGCVGLIMIGKFPEGRNFDRAKRKAEKSPYILLIEDSFPVNEPLISNEIDFFYRSLNDQSVAYTLYVATDVKKPVITHREGALPILIEKEQLGFTIDENEEDVPDSIIRSIHSWKKEGAEKFLKIRSWKVAAERLNKAVEN